MDIRLRHIEDIKAVPFATGEIGDVDSLMQWINASGGIYRDGKHQGSPCYQIVHDESGAYVEIIYGDDDGS